MAAAPDGCVVACLKRNDLEECLGDAEAILSRLVTAEDRCSHIVCTRFAVSC